MQVVDRLGPRDVLRRIPLLLLALKHRKNNASDAQRITERAPLRGASSEGGDDYRRPVVLRHGGGGGDVGGRLSGRKGSGKEKRRWVLGFWGLYGSGWRLGLDRLWPESAGLSG